jgi:putative ABC transport system ATP-binding protein
MLRIHNLSFAYNKDVTFQFPELECSAGNVLIISGKSGTGKTTFLHLIAGLLKANTGSITINNIDITTLSEKKIDKFRGQEIGIVFQKANFVSSLSVLENLELTAWLAGKNKQTEKAKLLLSQLDLSLHLHKKTSELSIGQQQRVSIARAVINQPKLILADEPTSSLDDENCFNVVTLLENTAKNIGAALVIVTHDTRLKEKYQHIVELK